VSEIDYGEFMDRPMTKPVESHKQFNRYLVYRNLATLERSVKLSLEHINKDNPDPVVITTLRNTAHKFKWHERAKAYDNYLSSLEIEVLETSLEEAVQYVLAQEDLELIMAGRLVQTVLRNAVEGKYDKLETKSSEADEAKKILQTLDLLQKMRRRRAGLPSNYLAKEAEPQNFEEMTYTIGAS
jgi:hypothetical protein